MLPMILLKLLRKCKFNTTYTLYKRSCFHDLSKAIEAGVDVVDCAISPMALGTSQPPTEPLVTTLKDTQYDTGYS